MTTETTETTQATRKLYNDDEKRRAVELARETNPQFAAQFLNVNVKTLYSWLNPPRREKQPSQPASSLETSDDHVEDRPAADNGDALKKSIDTLAASSATCLTDMSNIFPTRARQ